MQPVDPIQATLIVLGFSAGELRERPVLPLRSHPQGSGLRIAFYSHDTVGLGHVRRNLLIAESLRHCGSADQTLILSGAGQATALPESQSNRVVLSGLSKRAGRIVPTSGARLDSVLRTRSRAIAGAVAGFDPHVMVVDKVPRGVGGELEDTLRHLRRRGTRCILGLRDILDDPEVIGREWAEADNEGAISEFYDDIWVYGDRSVIDLATEYSFSDATAARLDYVGYLDRQISTPARLEQAHWDFEFHAPPGPYVLCSVGGGEDGARLVDTISQTELPNHLFGVILTGPFMPARIRRQLLERAATNPRLRILDFVREPGELLRRAERVISMGGYNSLCEIVSHQKPALVIPRVVPRREQWIRAERFASLGLLDLCHPDELTPEVIASWLEREVSPPDSSRLDMAGLPELNARLHEMSRSDSVAEAVAG